MRILQFFYCSFQIFLFGFIIIFLSNKFEFIVFNCHFQTGSEMFDQSGCIQWIRLGEVLLGSSNDGCSDLGVDGGDGCAVLLSSVTAQSSQREELKSTSHMCSEAHSEICCAVPLKCFPHFMHIQNMDVIVTDCCGLLGC